MVSTRTMTNVVGGEIPSDGVVRPSSSRSPRQSDKPAEEQSVASTSSTVLPKVSINFQYLPPEVLEKVAGFLPHRTVCLMRLVSRKMDAVCGGILNYKFQRLQTRMLARFQEIKTKMPRRESARRSHPLACESDIIETLHMRLTLLQMTFGKHIERKHCCFFAGEILDECDRILRYIKTAQKLARPYKVTDELYDLSTMAMEYFKEHIEPTLPEIAYFSSDFLEFTGSSYVPAFLAGDSVTATSPSLPVSKPAVQTAAATDLVQSNMVLHKRIKRIKLGMKRYNTQMTMIRRDVRGCRSKMAEQQKQIVDYSNRLDDNDKKNEETSRKLSSMLQQLNKCKTELQYWRSRMPAPPTPTSCNEYSNAFAAPSNQDLVAVANQGILLDGWQDVLPLAGSSKDNWGPQFEVNKAADESNKKEAAKKTAAVDEGGPVESRPAGNKHKINDGASGSHVPKKPRRVLERRGKKPQAFSGLK